MKREFENTCINGCRFRSRRGNLTIDFRSTSVVSALVS